MAASKSIIDEAYPGDVIGLYDSSTFKIGDTLSEGESLFLREYLVFHLKFLRKFKMTIP